MWKSILLTSLRGSNRLLRTWRRLPDELVTAWVHHPGSWLTLETPRSGSSLEAQFREAVDGMGAIIGLELPHDSMRGLPACGASCPKAVGHRLLAVILIEVGIPL